MGTALCLSCTATSPGSPRSHTVPGSPERSAVPRGLQGCALCSPVGWSCRSLWVSQPQKYAKSCRNLGKAECDTFVLWTGLEAVPAVAILPALPSCSVPGEPKPSSARVRSCVDLLRSDFPGGMTSPLLAFPGGLGYFGPAPG